MNLLFSYKGRIGRGSWWLGQLAILIITIVFIVAAVIISDLGDAVEDDGSDIVIGILAILGFPLLLWIRIVTSIKRFHDRGKKGVWVLVTLIPYIGDIWQIIECGCLEGQKGPNEYGPAPDGSIGHDPSVPYHPPETPMMPEPPEPPERPVKPRSQNAGFDQQRNIKTGRVRGFPTSPRRK